MEWMNRGGNAPQNTAQHTNTSTGAPAPASQPRPAAPGKKGGDSKIARVASVSLLFMVTLLVASVIAYLVIVKPGSINQGKEVDTTKYQAVFLNGGQVYFGKITATNNQYMKLSDIYYLRVNQQVQPNGQTANGDVQLVKLGCELHGPQDSMVINGSQVIFWENLKDDGQVAQAVAKYVKDNPNGQKCQTTTNNTTNTDATTKTP